MRIACLALTLFATPLLAESFPVRAADAGRYLVDRTGAPFFIHGDAAWSLLAALDAGGAERYLEDRRRRGYTALLVNLIEHEFAPAAPRNRNGDAPFLTPGDFAAPNEAYFRHADAILRSAEKKGILVFLFPCYFGYNGGSQGFWKELNAAGAEKAYAYGKFVGARYRDFTNIVWVHGGDYSPPEDSAGVRYALEIHRGIAEAAPGKLHTYHGRRSTTALDHTSFAPRLQLNGVYTGDELGGKNTSPAEPYTLSLRAYERPAFLPHFLIEGRYESVASSKFAGDYTSERHRLRRQHYWAVLSGAAGHFFGNYPVWPFGAGWDGAKGMDSPGNRDMGFLREVFTSRAWQSLIPDTGHRTVTAGYGAFGATDYVTAGRAAGGELAMAYVPHTGKGARTLTVDLGQFAGPVRAQWFNPADGSYTPAAQRPLSNSGSHDFVTPGGNGSGTYDWVLILERPRP